MTTTPPAPTLVAKTDASPSPRFEVTVSPMPGDAAKIWLYRSWAGGSLVLIRGASGNPVSGDFVCVDYEAPIGVPVTYYAQTADSGGIMSLVSSGSTATTLNVSQTWISDPLAPERCLAINSSNAPGATTPVLMQDAFDSYTYQSPSTITPIVGSNLPTLIGQARQAPSSFTLALSTYVDADAATLRNLLLTSYVVCVRAEPRVVNPFNGLAYVGIGDAVENPDRVTGRTEWALPMTQVSSPGLPVVISPRTYADLPGEAATYAALVALYTNYNAVKLGHN